MTPNYSEDSHRRKYNDLEWAEIQPIGPANYKIGDVVEFFVGGFGVITEVSQPHGGWPASYSTAEIEGIPPHKKKKTAWHYEGDFKRLVANSPLHSLLDILLKNE